jgi:hypothetical protein
MYINPNLGIPISETLHDASGFITDMTPGEERMYAPLPQHFGPKDTRFDDLTRGVLRILQTAPADQRVDLLPQLGFIACDDPEPDSEQLWRSAARSILARPNYESPAQLLYAEPGYFSGYTSTLLDADHLQILGVRPLNVTPEGKTSFLPASQGLRARNDWAEFTLESNRPTLPCNAVMLREPTLDELDITKHEAQAMGIELSPEITALRPGELLTHDAINVSDRFRVPLFYLRKLAALNIIDNLGPTDVHYDKLNMVPMGDSTYRIHLLRAAGDFGIGKPTPMIKVGDPSISNREIFNSKDSRWRATFYGSTAASDEQYREAIEATFFGDS